MVTFYLPGQSDSFGDTCTGAVGTLCLTLQNTQIGGTTNRGDVLSSLYFSVTGNPTLTDVSGVAGTVLNPNSSKTPILSVSPQSPVLSGGWALAASPGKDSMNSALPSGAGVYAWATVGNSGAISNGTYNVGTDNYSIISGTNAGAIGGGIPVISNEVFFTMSGFASGGSSLSLNTINNVYFAWNSNGSFSAEGFVPEPGTMGMAALALLGAIVGRWVLRRPTKAS